MEKMEELKRMRSIVDRNNELIAQIGESNREAKRVIEKAKSAGHPKPKIKIDGCFRKTIGMLNQRLN